MKPLVLALATLMAGGVARGQETAYQALRALAAERGQPLLNKVIEVVGSHGEPQPAKWKIVLDDPLARGGVREFEMRGGRIISERAPVRVFTGVGTAPVIDFKKLNLDSSGAFVVAEKEAVRARVGFDFIDYVLRSDADTGAPVWALHLVSSRGRDVGTLFVSAESGRVLRVEGMRGAPFADREPPRSGEPELEPDYPPVERGGLVGKLHNFGDRVKRHFTHWGVRLENFFTGKASGEPGPYEEDAAYSR